jgi:hypothetical protein
MANDIQEPGLTGLDGEFVQDFRLQIGGTWHR